jgi:hypothetical protein
VMGRYSFVHAVYRQALSQRLAAVRRIRFHHRICRP